MKKLKLITLLSVLMLLAGLNTIEAIAQTSELKLQSTQNRFTGEYVSGSKRLFVRYLTLTTDSSVSRIQNSKRRTIVESVRNKDVVTVKITDVTITFRLDKENPENSTASELSKADMEKLKKFSLSGESAPVRELVAELIKQKANAEVEQLKGFVAIVMVIGDGPGTPENLQSKTTCNSPKLIQMLASYREQSQPIAVEPNPANSKNSAANSCYCCGVGCACICWTAACVWHDVCVEQNGYTSSLCNRSLAAAIVSMYYFC